MKPKQRVPLTISNMHYDHVNSSLASHTEKWTVGHVDQFARIFETVWRLLSIQISDECIMLVKRAIKDEA